MTQHPGQPLAEVPRQAAALDVEALEVGVEVLARAVHAELRVALLVGGLVATELGEVGEGAEQLELVLEDRLPRRPHLLADREVPRQCVVLGGGGTSKPRTHSGEVAAGPGQTLSRRAALGGLRKLDRRSALTVASAAGSSSPTCSRRTSGVPVSTWLPVVTSSSLTRARNGACRTVSIFIDSSTMTGAPASTSSPTPTGVATTRAGAGERCTPPSSRVTRWATPSTSTSVVGPWVEVTTWCRWPPTTSRRWNSSRRSSSASTVVVPPPPATVTW